MFHQTGRDEWLFGRHEIHTNEIPLSQISYSDFVQLVVHQDIRPARPDEDEAPQMTDDIWQLAKQCWAKNPVARPNIKAVCTVISSLPGKHHSTVCDVFWPQLTHLH
jgi:hypothetical protein